MKNHKRELHVLMVTHSMQGHLNPMLMFAKLLVSKGVHVTLATTEVARQSMLNAKITPPQNTSTTTKFHLEFFSDGLSHTFDRDKYLEVFLESIQTIGYINLSNLIKDLTMKGTKFSCVVTNPFMPWVPNVAEEHNIPCAVLWIQACAVYSIYFHYFKHSHVFPPTLEVPHDVVELPGMPVLRVSELPSFILPSSPVFKKLMEDFVQNLDKVRWILGNTFDELEKDVVTAMASVKPIIPIGPLVSPFMLGRQETSEISGKMDLWSAEDNCIEWLDKKPPSSVIYISFGSMIVFTQDQIDSIASALHNTGKPFLWVIKPPQKGSDKQGGEIPSWLAEDIMEGKGIVVKWCPQETVLMHESIACFVTHCGWNSTLETVVAGVPVIAYPTWTDQPVDAKLLVEVLKIGVRLGNKREDGAFTSEEVERCIMEVMGDGENAREMKKRARELKTAAKSAVDDGGSSDMNINRFIKDIIGKSSSDYKSF